MNLQDIKQAIDKNISKKNQKYLIYVAGILLLLIGYFMIFSPLKRANDSMKTQIDVLTTQRDQYRVMDAHKAENKKQTARMQKELDEMLDRYPKNVYEEDIIQAMSNLEDNTDILISDITCENTNLVTSSSDYSTDGSTSSTSDTTTSTNTSATSSNKYQLYVKSSSISFGVGYEGIKAVAAYVKNGALKKNIESIYLTYDQDTGRLMGTMIINFYSISGEDIDKETREELPEVARGLTNVFKTAN